jgi:hypothetical protein
VDTVEQFFTEVKEREFDPYLRRISGTIRYDLTTANGSGKNSSNGSSNGSDHWTVSIDKGQLSVAHRNAKADTVVRSERGLFERIVTGRANAMASVLRGLVFIEGDPELAVLSARLYATNDMRGGGHV